MKKTIVSVILGGATFGAVLAGAMNSATALSSGQVTGPNQSTSWSDPGVTPAGATLHVQLSTSGRRARLAPTIFSTPNLVTFNAQMAWTCNGGSSQLSPPQTLTVTANNDNDAIIRDCPLFQTATSAFGVVDDI